MDTSNSDYVIFTLADGTELTVPRTAQISGNKIYYTTSDNVKIFPNSIDHLSWGAILVSNVYTNGQGVLTFDDAITKIGDSAFKGITNITSITIPDSVTKIGGLAFRGCYSLENISFGKGITEIPWSSFSLLGYQVGQDVKAHINIWSNVKTIAGYAFEGRRIDSLTIPANVEKIEDIAFSAASISNLWFEGRTNVSNFVAASIGNIYIPNEYIDFYKQQLNNYINIIKGYDFSSHASDIK